jgi:nitrogen fixation-related uncharacterized protein
MYNKILLLMSASLAVVVIVLVIIFFSGSNKQYSLDVDPLKDNQNLFSTSRVMLANVGRTTLTNIVVNYGGNAIERLKFLSPGEKVFLSPPSTSPLKSVTVTADHGISVTKEFRTPIKMPGMMGS